VAAYIGVASAWWTKPTLAQPSTAILPDGTWVCDITTGGIDAQADAIAAFVIPLARQVPIALGAAVQPLTLNSIAAADLKVIRP